MKTYISARQDADAANSTINKELAALRRGYNLLLEAGRLSRMPKVPTLRTDNTREHFLSMEDVETVCREISADLEPVVRFAALTGWRKGEIIAYNGSPGLQWQQVDFNAETVHLEPGSTKNREGRTFPFGTYPPLLQLLLRQRERTKAVENRTGRIVPHVFHRSGKPIKSMIGAWNGAWNGACKRAGLEGAWFHDLRRTAVRNLERAGVPRSVATKLTGHKTESVYRRYAIADEAALREGVERLAALHADNAGGGKRSQASIASTQLGR